MKLQHPTETPNTQPPGGRAARDRTNPPSLPHRAEDAASAPNKPGIVDQVQGRKTLSLFQQLKLLVR